MSPPGLPMVIPAGILVMVIALILGFSYYGADDWYIGVMVTVVGLVIVILMVLVNEQQDRKHHRPPSALKFDKKFFVLGTLVTMGGMCVILVAGGVLSGLASTTFALMGAGLLVAGIFMFVISFRG